MATSEEIKNALIGQLATFNGSSTEEQAMASENIGKIYVPTNEDVIIINKRRVGCGRNATTEKDGLMSATDKEALENVKTDIDDLQRAVGENIPNTYATKEEVEADFTAVNNSLAIASSTATDALGKANDAKGKVDNIISGTTVVPTAQNAQEALKATQDGNGNEITKTYATKAELKTTNDSLGTTAATANDAKSKVDKIISGDTVVPSATNAQIAQTATNLANNPTLAKGTNNTNAITVKAGGKKSDEFVVPYATTADKASKDGSGKVISDTYATKDELNDKLNASDAMVLAGTISGTGVIQSHNDNVVTQNVKNGTTNISALTDYKAGWTWRVVSDGTITNIGKVESGDMVMCVSDYNSAYKASDWSAIQRNIDLATKDAAGLMSAQDKANLDGALTHLDGIDTKINNIEGSITNINNDLTTNYATKTEMGAVEDKADAAQSTANEAKGTANSLVNGTTKAKKAETADSATKATQDGNGKVISDTYALRGEAVATQDLGKYVPVNKHTGGTLAFPLATQSAGGAMSSADKKKLDDTEGTYYSSFNVTGSGWYRLVNVPVNANGIEWKDRYVLVTLLNSKGSSTSASFKLQYNIQGGWLTQYENSFMCQPLTSTNEKCVDKVRLVFGVNSNKAQSIDLYVILPEGTTNIKVDIKSNIDAQYLAKNPVGADGKEGVAEAVLIALPEGYKSIERNAYVGNTVTSRVVGGLFSERSLQDINGKRIDEQYATKDVATTSSNGLMSKEDKYKLDNTIKNRVGNKVTIIRPRGEGDGIIIPQFQNEFAYATARGGYVKVFYGDIEQKDKGGDWLCDGTNLYRDMGGQGDTPIIIELFNNSKINNGSLVYVMFQGIHFTCKTIECYAKVNSTDDWTSLGKVEDNEDTVVAFDNLVSDADYFKFVFSQYKNASYFRPCEIGAATKSSKGGSDLFLPRNGGEIYGGITPLNDNAYDLGASGKAWKNVYGKQLTSTAADGSAPLVVSSKTMVANLNAEMVGGVNADSIVYNKNNFNIELGRYYKLFSFRRFNQKGDISFQVSGMGDGGYFFATFLINFGYISNLDDSTHLKINCLESYGKDLSQKVTATRRTTDNNGNTIVAGFDIWLDTIVTATVFSVRVLSNSDKWSYGWIDREMQKVDSLPTAVYTSSWGVNLGVTTKALTADKAYNADNAAFAGIVKSVAVPSWEPHSFQFASGQFQLGDNAGNAKEGSNDNYNLWSYPKDGTNVSDTIANIQTLRFYFGSNYWHDIFMSPNRDTIWHRRRDYNGGFPWKKIVEATEDGKIIIEGTTQEDTLRIKNKDRSTGEIHIFNGEQGNAVIRHYEGSTPTDLKFNSTQVMHGSKTLAYASDVTALQTEIANLKKTVEEQATLIEALQSALTWE